MPLYRLNTDSFIAPNRLKEGTVIKYNGPPGPHMDPMDGEADAALDTYYQEHPGATLHPTEGLGKTTDGRPTAQTAEVVSAPDHVVVVEQGFGTFAQPGQITPGVTDGGKLPEDAVVRGRSTPGGTMDPPGIGSNAPTSKEPLPVGSGGLHFGPTAGKAEDPGGDDSAKKEAAKANEAASTKGDAPTTKGPPAPPAPAKK